jgi:tRNA-splicing ligase RtcB
MYIYKPENGVSIKTWMYQDQYNTEDSIDRYTMKDQVEHVAQLPFTFHHVALMPDGHIGYGCPIGTVFASKGYVVPNICGVDIGCGVAYCQTNVPVASFKNVQTKDKQNLIWAMLSNITRNIPVGFNHHKFDQEDWLPNPSMDELAPIVTQEYLSSLKQLGTLGSGNHFIDLSSDKDGNLAIMLHSGSRNLGKKVCDHYNKLAKEMNELYFSSIPSEWQLSFLPMDSEEGASYLAEMDLCLIFAMKSRNLMMERSKNVVLNMLEKYAGITGVKITQEVNIHHNYAAMEHHFGENVLVHRKGATKAASNQLGIIPGSMASESYIIRGRGNKESFESCSHGAGRAMGRKSAMAKYTAQQVIEDMKARDIYVLKANREDIAEECVWAYKDVQQVIAQQSDLVDVVNTLKPIGVIIA